MSLPTCKKSVSGLFALSRVYCMLKDLLELPLKLLLVAAVMAFGYLGPITLIYFPTDVGLVELPPVDDNADAKAYYDAVYGGTQNAEHDYIAVNQQSAVGSGIEGSVKGFVAEFGLEDARVLEVGAGSGQLQDIVDDYTGLDIADSAARYFHKRFVQGSATDLPFGDSEFDSIWTVWTLEHVPDPEKALSELRRVVKPGGMLYVFPRWNCDSWAPRGLKVRPYENLSLLEKIGKASLSFRENLVYKLSYLAPVRAVRYIHWKMLGGETRLRYSALAPNYTHNWEPDSDAVASIDRAETMLWFVSRGDACLNCEDSLKGFAFMPHEPLFIRVEK